MRIIVLTALLALLVLPTNADALQAKTIRTALQYPEADSPQLDEVTYSIISIRDKYPHLTQHTISEISKAIAQASDITGLDWRLILAVIIVESKLCHPRYLHGDKNAGTSLGCMQINGRWWGSTIAKAGLRHSMLQHDIRANVIVGSVILAHKIKHYGLVIGIKRYNGHGLSTDRYLAKVLKEYLGLI